MVEGSKNRDRGVSLDDMIEEQRRAASSVILKPIDLEGVSLVGGVDVYHSGGYSHASAILYDIRSKTVVSRSSSLGEEVFPYLQGFLYKREMRLMVEAVRGMESSPDLLLVDGHGLAHPRGAGVAVFVGLDLMMPTVGIAKSLLVGRVGARENFHAPLMIDERLVGYMVGREGSKKYYISPGNLITVEDLPDVASLWDFRYPEVLREADRESRRKRMIG